MKCYKHPDQSAVGMCTSCGKTVCESCQIEVSNKLICKSCAEEKLEFNQRTQNNPNHVNSNYPIYNNPPNYTNPNNSMYPHATFSDKKNKDLASILAVFGGWFGLHKFYLNKPGQGIAMAIFSPTGIPFIISLAEAYMMFSSKPEEFDRKFNPELFTYKSLPNNENPMLFDSFENKNPNNNLFDERKRFSKKSIIDLEADFVDDNKKDDKDDNEKDDNEKSSF